MPFINMQLFVQIWQPYGNVVLAGAKVNSAICMASGDVISRGGLSSLHIANRRLFGPTLMR